MDLLKKVYWIINRLDNRSFADLLVSNSKWPIKCVTLNNIIKQYRLWWNFFYPSTVSVIKCGESYNTIEDPCAGV